ncbi:hypothetical protein SAMN02745146_2369 [Hymenobacter daecheongensis DSM 21074]|uniref:Uncharacterized protein n=1 Tax=Hymenobacter daecheongensis DSM 21074 TaxID=1121955 RepID=A0A1M6GS66_9BACT|nr:hypothetical protein [Hymenobacter daecheongensis]SHJ12772.1 hypothetical protein SAMN02745146_2369 [Hymenobacter daecheongensis DSM 21074]
MLTTPLLQVKDSFSLTGLGVLLLAEVTTAALARLDLHTVWPVRLVLPDGRQENATASVEEITRPTEVGAADTPARALLLTHEGAALVPAGTQVFLVPPAET